MTGCVKLQPAGDPSALRERMSAELPAQLSASPPDALVIIRHEPVAAAASKRKRMVGPPGRIQNQIPSIDSLPA